MKENTEYLHTDFAIWEIGPYHPALPGPIKLRLTLDGEIMSKVDCETGFLHRGLEKLFEVKGWRSAIPLADRVDPEAAVFGQIAYCSAVETIFGIEVPRRAQQVRMILSELSRISSHLRSFVMMGKSVSADTFMHYVLRDRERVLDLFELITGARFSLNFLRFGGVAEDVTEGFLERVADVCDMLRSRMKEYNDLFSFNDAFLLRACRVGTMPLETVFRYGVTGPNGRASGSPLDVRKAHPYLLYSEMDFEVPSGRGEFGELGDAHERYLLRLREISQSIEIIKQVCDKMADGSFCSLSRIKTLPIKAGEAYVRVESPRGLLGCHVVSEGDDRPARVHFRTPSMGHLSALPDVSSGGRLEDLPVILASLDISVAEVDR